jgi:hypothetical protein
MLKQKKVEGAMTEEQIKQQEKQTAQLSLLVSDRKATTPLLSKEELSKDKRFKTSGDKDYAVDPTNREYKKVV